jgi:hypothetical protein
MNRRAAKRKKRSEAEGEDRPVFDARVCEECGKDIAPDDAFVEIDIAADAPEEPLRAVRLHPADCLTKFRLKHPLRPVK